MRALRPLLLSPILVTCARAQTAHEAPANAPSRITIADSTEPGGLKGADTAITTRSTNAGYCTDHCNAW